MVGSSVVSRGSSDATSTSPSVVSTCPCASPPSAGGLGPGHKRSSLGQIRASIEVVLVDHRAAGRYLRVEREVECLQERCLPQVVWAQVDVHTCREERPFADTTKPFDPKLDD